jgi:hypothetical protein
MRRSPVRFRHPVHLRDAVFRGRRLLLPLRAHRVRPMGLKKELTSLPSGSTVPRMSPTKGAHQLAKRLEANRWSQREAARILGTGTGTICRWLKGDRLPDRHWAEELRRVLHIDPTAWECDAA